MNDIVPGSPFDRSIEGFRLRQGLYRSTYYRLVAAGRGPAETRISIRKVVITPSAEKACRRFEIVGAELGRAFALAHDMGERRAEVVWDSIALHTIASIAQHKGTDVACCQSGISCDFGGVGYQQLSDDDKKVILSAYPRLNMKKMLTTCLCDIAKNHPNTTRDNFIADFGLKYVPGYTRMSSVDFLHQAPFVE